MKMFKKLHHSLVSIRRKKVLSGELSAFLDPEIKSMLDIGCGDGIISKLILEKKPHIRLSGIDILERPSCAIPFTLYDGKHIPFTDNSFDVCMFNDVLHHLPDIKEMLAEARRVARYYILIKDHQYKNRTEFNILKFMDDVGNKPYGVERIYNYLNKNEWKAVFDELRLKVITRKTKLPLYPFPFNLLFGRQLHFICLLRIEK